MAENSVAVCLDCGAPIDLGLNPVIDDHLECPACGAAFDVIALRPIELDWAFLEPTMPDSVC
jgi:lysine biosynthesis protein LysW